MTLAINDPKHPRQKIFHGIADPSRLSILETLRGGPCCVAQIIASTGLSQSNVSNHLACLKDCGLVSSEQRGRQVYYRLSSSRVEQLLAAVDALLQARPDAMEPGPLIHPQENPQHG